MTTLAAAWALARKDLTLFFRDRTAMILSFALPIVLATVFGSAMKGMVGGGGGGGTPRIEVLFQDEDHSTSSEALLASLDRSAGIRPVAGADARRRISNGDYAAAIVVPSGYGAALDAGEIPKLQLLRDPSRGIAQQVIAGNLMPVLIEVLGPRLGSATMGRFLDLLDFPGVGRKEAEEILTRSWDGMAHLVDRLEEEGVFDHATEQEAGHSSSSEAGASSGFDFLEDVPALFGVVAEDVAGEDPEGPPRSAGGSHAVASMAVMMLMFSLVAAGGTLLEERDGGTLQRLLLAPAVGGAIVWGKVLSLGLVGALQLALLFAYGAIAFDVPVLERPLALGVTAIGLVLAATGLGMLFAVACSSRKQMEGLSTLVILVMSAVGGAWFPREITPEWFRTAGLFTVTAYAMDAFHGILWYGKGLLGGARVEGVLGEVAALWAIGVALIAVSIRIFHRRYRST